MRKQLVLGILAAVISSAAPTFASDTDRDDRSGFDVGRLGQCFDARACGGAYYGAYPPATTGTLMSRSLATISTPGIVAGNCPQDGGPQLGLMSEARLFILCRASGSQQGGG